MAKKLFAFTLFTLFTVFTIVLYSGHSHDEYPHNNDLPSSEYADVHGQVFGGFGGHDTDVHVHGITFAHWDREGNYTILLTASGEDPVSAQDSFDEGVREERDLTFATAEINRVAMGWTASATLEIKKNDSTVIHRDYDEKKAEKAGENDDWKEGANSSPGLKPKNGSYAANPGDSHEAVLITDAPYSSVTWYVNAPGDVSGTLGSNMGSTYAQDSGSTEASFSYTFPSGAMHTGDYTITAYIYRANQTVYQESYTVTVQ